MIHPLRKWDQIGHRLIRKAILIRFQLGIRIYLDRIRLDLV